MPDLEVLLGEYLSPVRAPRELWDRVHTPREPHPARVLPRLALAASAVVLVMGSAVGLHAQMKRPSAMQPAQAPRLQAWLKSSTGLDIHGACRLCHEDDAGVY